MSLISSLFLLKRYKRKLCITGDDEELPVSLTTQASAFSEDSEGKTISVIAIDNAVLIVYAFNTARSPIIPSTYL